MMLPGFGSFWVAFLVSGAFAFPIYRALLRWKSRQTISQYAPEKHMAKQGTPTMGGLICIVGISAALASSGAPLSILGPLLILTIGFAMIGFLDDFVVPRLIQGKRGLGWKQKLSLQILVSFVAVWLLYPGASPLLWIGAGICVMFFSNAYNFADGLDGLSGGLLLAMLAGLGGILAASPWAAPMAIVAGALAGAILPFLFLNAPPAKVFMGDVGSLPIGALLGVMVCAIVVPISSLGHLGVIDPWKAALCLGILSLVMAIELVPVPLQIASVKLRKRKLFLYTPIHHAFEMKGWPESKVVWTFILAQIVLSALAWTAFVSPAMSPVLSGQEASATPK